MRVDLDVIATRGELVESRHRVHAAIADASGRIIGGAGDTAVLTVWRSCAKPFQVLSFLESGHLDELGWGEDEVAIACGSHGGEPEHVALARAMLDAIDLEEGDLVCGPHDPLARRGARLMQQSGEGPTRLHNNCSGKHAALLAYARTEGWPTLGYEQCVHPVQQRALERVARWSSVPAQQIGQTVDGCGVVAFASPLDALARAFARFGAAARRGDEISRRVLTAMATRPFLVGGTDRFDTILMEETDGRIVAKIGAEGVHAVVAPDEGVAFALKVEDGATRAQHPAVLRLLQHLDLLPGDLPPRLVPFLHTPVINTRGAAVGEIRPVA